MNLPTSDKIRNEQDRDNNSPEQERKIKKGQDVEPQAEKWNERKPDKNDRKP